MRPANIEEGTDLNITHHPVATATGWFRTIFLMDTLRTQDTLDLVLQNYLGLFAALKGQTINYIVLTTIDPKIGKEAQEKFESTLNNALPPKHTIDFRLYSTVDLCRLLRELLPELPDSACKDLQYPSLFAQDPFIALRYSPGFLTLLSSIYSSISFSYSFVADAVANGVKQQKRFVLPTNYSLTGGNILAQPDWAIIGKDTLDLNLSRQFTPAILNLPGDPNGQSAQITRDLKALLGVKEIYWTGTDFKFPPNPFYQQGTFQPCFHIDFYLTPAGPVANRDTGELEEVIFVGELTLLAEPRNPEEAQVLAMMARGLDEAAEQFDGLHTPAGLPFRVVRVPLLFVGITPDGYIINKLLSYNQVLVQNTPEEKTVFLPDYVVNGGKIDGEQYAPYQDLAIEIYERTGFQVSVVQGRYRDYSFFQGGSLHCIAKVMDRTQEA